MAKLIADGHVAAAHDVSDGGYAVAAAEMMIASGKGLNLDPEFLGANDPFEERAGRYIVEMRESALDAAQEALVRKVTIEGQEIHASPPRTNDPIADALGRHFGNSAQIDRLGFVQNLPCLFIISHSEKERKLLERITVDELTSAWRGTLDW
jgi:hypothetical protein